MRIYNNTDLAWHGPELRLGNTVIAMIQRHDHQLWRVTMPSGFRTDFTNRSRAKDAARTLALSELNRGAV